MASTFDISHAGEPGEVAACIRKRTGTGNDKEASGSRGGERSEATNGGVWGSPQCDRREHASPRFLWAGEGQREHLPSRDRTPNIKSRVLSPVSFGSRCGSFKRSS